MLKQLEFAKLTKKMEAGTLTDAEFERAMQLMTEIEPEIETSTSEALDAIANRLQLCNNNGASVETRVKLIEQGMATLFSSEEFRVLGEETLEKAIIESENE